ncbi:MAG: hypothetical protein BWY70_01320 [Bacteroidetes bacterium ADurb.Bin408]|nr:MAG: hypothetical protein BWY70_01320 [Bacteroidetes bacterium ADurb.Bin408]
MLPQEDDIVTKQGYKSNYFVTKQGYKYTSFVTKQGYRQGYMLRTSPLAAP